MFVKLCGITNVDDARLAVDAGADAIGLNFWPGSVRAVTPAAAKEIADATPDGVRLVGVFVDASLEEILSVRRETGIGWVQLHGSEPVALLERLLPEAYKALSMRDASSVAAALQWPGEEVLLDAAVPGQPGGTGRTFDWELAAQVARARPTLLAGGLHPGNVGEAIRTVRPWGVDVASGVERAPGLKDAARMRAFVDEARRATASNR